jgi:hypothetical protein
MQKEQPEQSFGPALADWARMSDALEGRGFIVGGVAVAAVAEARATKDIDSVFVFDDREAEEHLFQSLVSKGREFGFEPRAQNPIALFRKSLVRPSCTPPAIRQWTSHSGSCHLNAKAWSEASKRISAESA